MWRPVKVFYFTVATIIAVGILVKSAEYLTPRFDRGFLIGKDEIFHFYRFGLFAHIFSAPLAFFFGIFQFLFLKSPFHKHVGKAYVFLVLFLAAPSGLFMAFFAIGGAIGTLNFLVLSFLWWFYTLKAYQAINRREFHKHKRYITGSFILANSAILLRILGFINNQTGWIEGINGYLVVSALSWLPALLIYEIRIHMQGKGIASLLEKSE